MQTTREQSEILQLSEGNEKLIPSPHAILSNLPANIVVGV